MVGSGPIQGQPKNVVLSFAGRAEIPVLRRYGKRQAEAIVRAHTTEDWFTKKRVGSGIWDDDLDSRYNPSGAPQGFLHKLDELEEKQMGALQKIPAWFRHHVNKKTEDLFLRDMEHYLQLQMYFERRGQWVPVAVAKLGSCMFDSIRRGIQTPVQFTNRIFRRQLAVFCARNADIIRKQHLNTLYTEYGIPYSNMDSLEGQGPHKGPYSICDYILEIMEQYSWGDSIILDMVSRMWGLRITVLDVESWVEHRIRHQKSLDNADVVLIFAGGNHYRGTWRRSPQNVVPVHKLLDAPELEDGDSSENEDTNDEDPPDLWKKVTHTRVRAWQYKNSKVESRASQAVTQMKSLGVQAGVEMAAIEMQTEVGVEDVGTQAEFIDVEPPAVPLEENAEVSSGEGEQEQVQLEMAATGDGQRDGEPSGGQEQEERQPCIFCGKLFTTTRRLIIHQRRHFGEERFICDICGKRYSYNWDWTHTGRLMRKNLSVEWTCILVVQ